MLVLHVQGSHTSTPFSPECPLHAFRSHLVEDVAFLGLGHVHGKALALPSGTFGEIPAIKGGKTTSNIIITPKEERCKQGRHRRECRSKLLCKRHLMQLFGTDTLISKTFFASSGSLRGFVPHLYHA